MRGMRLWLGLVATLLVVAGAAAADDSFPQSVASGDPTADSVVLWTRVAMPDGDLPETVNLVVATDHGMANVVVSRSIEVDPEYDGAVKVKVDGLMPYHDYYYQFGFGDAMSTVGRTRTAPTPEMDVPVRFAVVYCQDYIGRYYNTYMKLLLDHDEDIDFVVHLGDYVYETTGDPSFQDPTSDRRIEFEDTAGAIQLGTEENPNYAAASLSNYRDLYRPHVATGSRAVADAGDLGRPRVLRRRVGSHRHLLRRAGRRVRRGPQAQRRAGVLRVGSHRCGAERRR